MIEKGSIRIQKGIFVMVVGLTGMPRNLFRWWSGWGFKYAKAN